MADAWVSSVPTKSSTTSAPTPFVASRTASATSACVAEHLVCAELAREPAPALVRVDPDDRRRPERANELERDVADASDPDDRRGGAGSEPRKPAASPRGTR